MIKTITFSDCSPYRDEHCIGKALSDLEVWCRVNPKIEIIKIIKRRRYIANAGNGNEYYDLDVIFSEEDNDGK